MKIQTLSTHMLMVLCLLFLVGPLNAQQTNWTVNFSHELDVDRPYFKFTGGHRYIIGREADGLIFKESSGLYGGYELFFKHLFNGRKLELAKKKDEIEYDNAGWFSENRKNNYIMSPTGKSYLVLSGGWESSKYSIVPRGKASAEYYPYLMTSSTVSVKDRNGNLIRNIELPSKGIRGICYTEDPSKIFVVLNGHIPSFRAYTNDGIVEGKKQSKGSFYFGYFIATVDLVSGKVVGDVRALSGAFSEGIDAIGFFSSFFVNKDLVVIGASLIDVTNGVVVQNFSHQRYEMRKEKIGYRIDQHRFVLDKKVYNVSKLDAVDASSF